LAEFVLLAMVGEDFENVAVDCGDYRNPYACQGWKVYSLVYIISHLNMDRTAHSQVFQDYQPNDSLFDSHFTRLTQSQANEDNWFIEQKAYSRSVLAGWGLPLG